MSPGHRSADSTIYAPCDVAKTAKCNDLQGPGVNKPTNGLPPSILRPSIYELSQAKPGGSGFKVDSIKFTARQNKRFDNSRNGESAPNEVVLSDPSPVYGSFYKDAKKIGLHPQSPPWWTVRCYRFDTHWPIIFGG